MTWSSVWALTWPHAVASLQALEDRFAALIEPTLAAAMTQRSRERVQKLAAMLVGMGRPEAVERLYNTARLAPLQVGLHAAAPSCLKVATGAPPSGAVDDAQEGGKCNMQVGPC